MGQVPKNNIIKAQEGATLSLKVNGVLKKIPVEKADEMAANEADRLVSVGELRPSEKEAYMSSWNTLRDKMTSGEYDINTAGKNTVSGIKYTGPENTFGLQKDKAGETEASERGRFGSTFSKKTRRDRPSDVEAVVTRTMFPKIGGWTLDDDEATATKTKADAEALKIKQTTDSELAKAAHTKEWGSVPFDEFLSKEFGGNKDYTESLLSLSPEERESVFKRHSDLVTSNWLNYEPLKGASTDWMSAHKDANGTIKYGPEYYKDFYRRAFGDRGLAFANKMYGEVNSPETTLTPEEKVEADKAMAIKARDTGINWSKYTADPRSKKIDENTIEISDLITAHKADPSRKFKTRFVKDPTKNEIVKQLVERLSSTRPHAGLQLPSVGGEGEGVIYERRISELDKKPFYVNVKNPKDIIPIEDVEDVQGLPIHKEGGNIKKLQSGGWASSDASEEAAAIFAPKKASATKSTTATTSTPAKEPTKTKGKDTTTKLSDIGGRWSASDNLELASLAADIGGLAASFIPGGSAVSGVSGLAGTGLAMAAEKSRGELGWEDTGKYALSGLMDLASVVPGIGIAAKVGKLNKSAAKTANIIFKASKAGLLGVGAGMTGVALTNVANKLSKDGFNSLTVQDLKTLTQGLTLLGHTAKSFAAPKAVELKPLSGEKTMGKAIHNVTGAELNKPLIKDKDNNWVFEDQALAKDYNIGRSNPLIHKSEIYGAEDKIVNVPYMNKSKFDPATGKEKSFLERNAPLSKMTNKYIKKAGGPESVEPTKPVEVAKPAEVTKPVEAAKPVETPVVEVKKETPLVTAAQEAVNKKATMLAEANKERLAKIVENAKKEKAIEKEVLSAKPKEKAKGAVGVRAREAVRESSLSTTPRRNAKVSKKLNGGLILKAGGGDVLGKPQNWLSTLTKTATNFGVGETPINQNYIKPLTGKINITGTPQTKIGNIQSIAQAHAKDATIFDKLKNINPNDKQALAMSEFGRTMFLNKTLSGKQNPLYIPNVTDKAETRLGVTGDLLTKSAYYNRANQTMSSANAYKTSDATANFLRNLAASDQANQLRGQGDLVDAQAMQRSKEMQAQGDEANAVARKQNADQRAMYFTKALAAKNEADWDIKAQKASNLNTLWASQNLAKKQDIAEKEGGLKNIAFSKAQAEIESRYPGIVRKYYLPTGGVDPAYKAEYEKYSNELLDAQKRIMYQKSGGELSAKYKHDSEMSKRENSFRRDMVGVINKWTNKQGNKNYSGSLRTSKELNDLVSKIFTK